MTGDGVPGNPQGGAAPCLHADKQCILHRKTTQGAVNCRNSLPESSDNKLREAGPEVAGSNARSIAGLHAAGFLAGPVGQEISYHLHGRIIATTSRCESALLPVALEGDPSEGALPPVIRLTNIHHEARICIRFRADQLNSGKAVVHDGLKVGLLRGDG